MIWLYVVEINTWSFRIAGSAIATILEMAVGLSMSVTTSYLITYPGWPAVYLAVSALAGVTVYLLCPETTGRSLEWLDRYFEHDPPLLVIRNKDKASRKVKWTR